MERTPQLTSVVACAAALLTTCGLFAAAAFGSDWPWSFELDHDEGANSAKALAFARGAELYGALWSDQPPLSTIVWSLAPSSHVLLGGRISALLSTMAASVAAVLLALQLRPLDPLEAGQPSKGITLGVVAAVALCSASGSLKAAGAMMIGVPALSMALWAALLATAASRADVARRRGVHVALVLGAFFFGCASICTKMWGLAIIVPLCAPLVVWGPRRAGGVVGIAGAVVGVAVVVAVGGDDVVLTHVRAAVDLGRLSEPLGATVGLAGFVAVIAAGGASVAAVAGARHSWGAVGVVVGGGLAIAVIAPRWWHHGTLLAVAAAPGAVLAYRIALAHPLMQGPLPRLATTASVVLCAVAVVAQGRVALSTRPPDHCAQQALRTLRNIDAGVLVTDRPVLVAHSPHRGVAQLAVPSLKRMFAGGADAAINDDVIIGAVDDAGDALAGVWLERRAFGAAERALMGRGFRRLACDLDPGAVLWLPPLRTSP